MSALWAALGVGLGAIVRNQVAAIVGLFTWVFVAETFSSSTSPPSGGTRRARAGTALTGQTVGESSVDLLTAPLGGLVLAAYAAIAIAAGALVTRTRGVV